VRQADTQIAESGPRAVARRIFTVGIWVLFASIILQFLLAGLGVFDDATFFSWHANANGAVVGLLPLVLVAIGWYARVPRQTLLLTAAIFGLVVLQSLLLFPYHLGATGLLRAASGLHVVNGLAIFVVGLRLIERSEALRHNRAPG
jgi:hypothetical protein